MRRKRGDGIGPGVGGLIMEDGRGEEEEEEGSVVQMEHNLSEEILTVAASQSHHDLRRKERGWEKHH